MEPSFAPLRRTRVRELRPGDQIVVPTEGTVGGIRGVVTDLQENEDDRLITINGEVDDGEGLFYHDAPPNEFVARLLLPGDPIPGTETIMVKGSELWKWIGEPLNDPNGSGEKYTILTFRRISDPETGEPLVEIRMQSQTNRMKQVTAYIEPTARIAFDGCR